MLFPYSHAGNFKPNSQSEQTSAMRQTPCLNNPAMTQASLNSNSKFDS